MTHRNILFLTFVLASLAGCGFMPDSSSVPADVNTERVINADSEPQNWLSYSRTYDEQRFSPLTDINADSVTELGLAWHLDLGTDRGLEASPLVVDGVMYVSGAWNNIYAINAVSGALLWHYDPQTSRAWVAEFACCDAVSRGLAVYQGKVIAATLDGRLFAVDAANDRFRKPMQTKQAKAKRRKTACCRSHRSKRSRPRRRRSAPMCGRSSVR